MAKHKLNKGHYLELMDRLYVVTETIDGFILKHPLSQNEKDIHSKIEEALNLLLDTYRLIGSKQLQKNRL